MNKDSRQSDSPSSENSVKAPTVKSGKGKLDQDSVQTVFDQHARNLRMFLLGVLKDDAAANDAMQATFVQLIEKGHTIKSNDWKSSSVKSWLFRVAFNEAMLVKRRAKTATRHQEKVAWLIDRRGEASQGGDATDAAIRGEDIGRVRDALEQLPAEQKLIVIKRIHEGMKFREIAEELDLPLGTVLSRMHAGLKRLKGILEEN